MTKEKTSQVETLKTTTNWNPSWLASFQIYKNKNEYENLNQNQKNIVDLQKFIENLYNCKNTIINDKKNIWKKEWLVLNSEDKTVYESIIDYFINDLLQKENNWKQVFFNPKFIEQKFKLAMTKKEQKDIWDLDAFNFKSLKSNFIENFNNKFIIDYIKENENLTSWKLELLKSLLKELETLKTLQKEKVELLKEKAWDNKKEYKKLYKELYKKYDTETNKTRQKIKSLHLKEKYSFLVD